MHNLLSYNMSAKMGIGGLQEKGKMRRVSLNTTGFYKSACGQK